MSSHVAIITSQYPQRYEVPRPDSLSPITYSISASDSSADRCSLKVTAPFCVTSQIYRLSATQACARHKGSWRSLPDRTPLHKSDWRVSRYQVHDR